MPLPATPMQMPPTTFIGRLLENPRELREASQDPDRALALLKRTKWGGGPVDCPRCGKRMHEMKGGNDHGKGRWRCKPCKEMVTPTNGTAFDGEKLPAHVLLRGLYLASRHKGDLMHLASRLQKELGLTTGPACRLALVSLDRVKHAREGREGGKGLLHVFSVGAALVGTVVLMVAALIAGHDHDGPLETSWTSGGSVHTAGTVRLPAETHASARQRHARKVAAMKLAFPPERGQQTQSDVLPGNEDRVPERRHEDGVLYPEDGGV